MPVIGANIKRKARTLFFNTALSSLALPVYAIDIQNGEFLHNENCTRCHQPTLYEREDRIVKTLQHLRTQVQFCEVSNDLTWFDEEVDDVTEYLNLNYYLFDLK